MKRTAKPCPQSPLPCGGARGRQGGGAVTDGTSKDTLRRAESPPRSPSLALPNRPSPGQPVVIDPAVCTGCNRCVEVCQVDVLLPNPEKGKPPILLYPDECWYEGSCVEHCPRAGAIRLNHPLAQRVRWKRKGTGETFRV